MSRYRWTWFAETYRCFGFAVIVEARCQGVLVGPLLVGRERL